MSFANHRFVDHYNITHYCKLLRETSAKIESHHTISFSNKSTREDPPMKSDQNNISINVLWGSFRHRSAPMLRSRHQKITFSTTSVLLVLRVQFLRLQKYPRRRYSLTIYGASFVCNEPRMPILYCPLLASQQDVMKHRYLASSLQWRQ